MNNSNEELVVSIHDEDESALDTRSYEVEDVLGTNGIFKEEIPNFVARPGQLEMAKAWKKTIDNGSLLVCEAGTGTGKTFAYLVPAIASRKSLIISTASKALQDQLVYKDLPKLFELLNITPNFMVLKGFSNYLCLKKYHEVSEKYLKKHTLKFDEPEESKDTKVSTHLSKDEDDLDDISQGEILNPKVFAKIENLIATTNHQIENNLPNIDFAEVNSKFSKDVSNLITCAPEWCLKKKCKEFENCYPYLAREKALRTKVVVINHSLFFSDIKIDDPGDLTAPAILLPKYRQIIFDEAHELPSIGRAHLSEQVGYADLRKFKEDLKYIRNSKTIPYQAFEDQVKILAKSYAELDHYLHEAEGGGTNHRNILFYKYQDYDDTIKDPYFQFEFKNDEFLNLMRHVYGALKQYLKFIRENKDLDSDFFSNVEDFILLKMETIVNLMKLDEKDDPRNICYGKYVGSVEVFKKGFSLKLTPLEISEVFGKYLSDCDQSNISILMTSATLSVNHKFNKFLRDIGADSKTEVMEVESPFDYGKQSAIYASDSFPEINDRDRIESIVNTLLPTIEAVQGGIFFLTTSYKAMESANVVLYKHLAKTRKIFCQNRELSNSKMLEEFKHEGNAVLIGTSSFWAGVDVQGSALSLVIIDKLPFESPSDPIFSARCKYFDANNNFSSFVAISIPEAVISLRQGVGRLIRHESDTGGLIICDPRIKTKRYGSTFINSLPSMAKIDTQEDFDKFLSTLNKKL